VVSKLDSAQLEQLREIGVRLHQTREQQSKSLEEIAAKTFIPLRLLRAIEVGQAAILPEPIFIQGFIRRYGDMVGLDGVALSKQFPLDSTFPVVKAEPPKALPVKPTPQFGASSTGSSSKAATPKSVSPGFDSASAQSSPIQPSPIQSNSVPSNPTQLDSIHPKPVKPPLRSEPIQSRPVYRESVRSAPIQSDSIQDSVQSEPTYSRSIGSEPNRSSSRINPLYVLCALAGLVVVGGALYWASQAGLQQGEPALQETQETVEPNSANSLSPASDSEPEASPTPSPQTSANQTAPLEVSVELTEASWMRVTADGEILYEGILQAGEQQSWTANEQLTIRAGNAGAVSASFNGAAAAPLGGRGEVETVTFP
jgi:cytoskeleton protein RodZ